MLLLKKMVKPKDPVWNLFILNSNSSVNCKFCPTKYTLGNVCKMRKHISKCAKCPAEAKQKYLKLNASTSSQAIPSTQPQLQPTTSNRNLTSSHIKNFVDSITKSENVRNMFFL